MCSPLMPGITDNAHALDTMARKARDSNASFFYANPLFLKPCSKGTFLAFVHEHFPQLDASYAKRYQESAFVSKAYQRRVSDLVAAVTTKYGLGRRSTEALMVEGRGREPESREPRQQTFWPVEETSRKRAPAQVSAQRVMMTS